MPEAASQHILYLANSYANPEQVNAGPASRCYYNVAGLVRAGAQVDVCVGALSTVSDQQLESSLDHNLKIHAVATVQEKKNRLYNRIAYHSLLFINSIRVLQKIRRVDLVVASTPTILIAVQGLVLSRLRGARLIIDVRDLWSESLTTTKLGRVPFLADINLIFERYLYSKADLITCTSTAQADTVRRYLGEDAEIYFVPNGVDPKLFQNAMEHPFIRDIRKSYPKIALHTGNFSNYAALHNYVDVAEELEDDGIALVLVGGGYTKNKVVTYAKTKNVPNIFFHDPVPKKDIKHFLTGGDVFVINYSPSDAWKNVLPNKLFDYMFWNKPIVAAVVEGDISRTLKESGAGARVTPGDTKAIADAIRKALNSDSPMSAKDYLLKHYDREKTVELFTSLCSRVLGK